MFYIFDVKDTLEICLTPLILTLNHLIPVNIIIFSGDGGDCQGGSSNNWVKQMQQSYYCHDNYTIVKTENEVLKEKVDVLFKLGRSYINNVKNSQKEAGTKSSIDKDEDIQVVEEDDTDNIENLEAWTKNKMRGFKRVNPSAPPKPGPAASHTAPPQKPPSTNTSAPGTTNSSEKETLKTPAHNSYPEDENRYKGRYCHYFVNTGKCNYEDKTGIKCRFEHKIAPMCNFGLSCSRPKCMFSHPKVNGNGNNPFLGNMRGLNPLMNPWQMINPWITPQQNQFQNQPWNAQGYQGNANSQ